MAVKIKYKEFYKENSATKTEAINPEGEEKLSRSVFTVDVNDVTLSRRQKENLIPNRNMQEEHQETMAENIKQPYEPVTILA